MLIHTTHLSCINLITNQMIAQFNQGFFPLNPIYIQDCIQFLPINLTIWRRPAPALTRHLKQQIQVFWSVSDRTDQSRTRRDLSTLLYIQLTSDLYPLEITAKLWPGLWVFHSSPCDIEEDHGVCVATVRVGSVLLYKHVEVISTRFMACRIFGCMNIWTCNMPKERTEPLLLNETHLNLDMFHFFGTKSWENVIFVKDYIRMGFRSMIKKNRWWLPSPASELHRP